MLKSFNFPLFATLFLASYLTLWAVEIQQKETHYPDGGIKERYGYYLDQKKHEIRDGQAEEFFLSGAKKGDVNWKAGKENGLVIYYYPDGRKSYEANYLEGQKNGYVTVWYPTGQKQWQTVFRFGSTHGVWREWFPDGKKKFEANYNEGKLEGLATWWHDNGHIWQERSYQSGQLIKGSVREWNKSGMQTFPPIDDSGVGSAIPSEPGKNDSARVKSDAKPGL